MRLPTTLLLTATLVAGAALGISACGEQGGQATSPAQTAERRTATEPGRANAETRRAVAEIGQVESLLRRALATYRRGERAAAERLVGDAYLEHFELVEHPLEERDRELMEKLEVGISTTIRNRMKQGAPPAEIERLVDQTARDLDQARRLLAS